MVASLAPGLSSLRSSTIGARLSSFPGTPDIDIEEQTPPFDCLAQAANVQALRARGALAERLGVHRTTVARWEIGEVAIGQAESVALRALAAMQVLEQKPKLAREVASRFGKPGTKRALPPYEIEVGAA